MTIFYMEPNSRPKPGGRFSLLAACLPIFMFCLIPFRSLGIEVDLKRLQQLDNKASKDTSNLSEMLVLTADLLKENPDEAMVYLEKIKKAAESEGYDQGILAYCEQRYAIAKISGHYQETVDTIRRLYDRTEDDLSAHVQQKVQMVLANALRGNNQFDEAIKVINQVLPQALTEDKRAALLLLRADVLSQTGRYKEATADYLKALVFYKNKRDDAQLALIFMGLGGVNFDMEDFSKAIQYYKEAVTYAERSKNERTQSMIYSDIGIAYRRQGSNAVALPYLQKSLELARKVGNFEQVARSLMNIGNVQVDLSQFPAALKSYQASLDLCRERNISYGVMLNHMNIGLTNMHLKHYGGAKLAFDSALVYVQQLHLPYEEAKMQEQYASLYEETGDYRKALGYFKKFYELRDKLFSEEKQKAIAELEIKYQSTLKDQELELVERKFQEKRAQNRTLILAIVLMVLATGFTTYFMLYRNKSLRKLYNRNMELLNALQMAKVPDKKEEGGQEGLKGNDTLRVLFDKLLILMERDDLYKNPDLSIGDIAEKLLTNEKYVSQAISAYAKMNYNNFINFYRINEAKRLIYESPQATSLNEVMYHCGFSSRTTFYNAFQKFTDMSPKQFKSMAQSSSSLVAHS